MSNFFSVITFRDVVFSFTAACMITYLIKTLRLNYRFIGIYKDIKIAYDPVNLKTVIKNCRELFPLETVSFNGNAFMRGSIVEILTVGNRKIIGELIGANADNMICLVTKKHIIARELSEVRAMTLVDGAESDL